MLFFHHTHKRKILLSVIITVSVILIFGGLWKWHVSEIHQLEDKIKDLEKKPLDISSSETPDQHQPVSLNGETKSYTNSTYDYTLEYPVNLQIKNYNDTNSTIGVISQSGNEEYVNGKVSISVESGKTSSENSMTLEKFIFSKAKLLCDADGGGVSVSCPKQKNIQKLETTSGLSAYTLTLLREEKTIGPEASTSTSESIFYIVDLSTDKARSILILYPVGDGSIELTKQVAESVQR
jgi:cytoskeletal protein RodZ